VQVIAAAVQQVETVEHLSVTVENSLEFFGGKHWIQQET